VAIATAVTILFGVLGVLLLILFLTAPNWVGN
jgi:hypothetical protein